MTTDASHIHAKLRLAVRLIDEAAGGVTALGLAPVRDNVCALGEAIACVSEVLQVVYEHEPSLRPRWLEDPNPHPGVSRAYGELIIKVEQLRESGEHHAAIQSLQEFLKTGPPRMFAELASSQLEYIQELDDTEDDKNS